MSSLLRKYKRIEEKKEQENIKKLYGKKPKGVCPKCKLKSLFYTNEKKETFCVRCDSIVNR